MKSITRIPAPRGFIIDRIEVNPSTEVVKYEISVDMHLSLCIASEADQDINYQRATLELAIRQLARTTSAKLAEYIA